MDNPAFEAEMRSLARNLQAVSERHQRQAVDLAVEQDNRLGALIGPNTDEPKRRLQADYENRIESARGKAELFSRAAQEAEGGYILLTVDLTRDQDFCRLAMTPGLVTKATSLGRVRHDIEPGELPAVKAVLA